MFFLDSNVKPAPRSCRFLGPSHPHAVNGEWPQPLQGDGPEITPHRPRTGDSDGSCDRALGSEKGTGKC